MEQLWTLANFFFFCSFATIVHRNKLQTPNIVVSKYCAFYMGYDLYEIIHHIFDFLIS